MCRRRDEYSQMLKLGRGQDVVHDDCVLEGGARFFLREGS